MARSNDDSWDITESVGATALGVAMARANETAARSPLFTDPCAQMFLDAAAARGWRPPTGTMAERVRAIGNYAASRTKWFDEFFVTAGAAGIRQAVILAAGLDARAWRLPWVHDSVVFEIDQPQVLQFKEEVLAAHRVAPKARHVAVPIDLRQDWPKALQDAGFDATEPTAWSVEGLLPYLPADAQDLLFERITELSARDSRIAVEAFGADFFSEEHLARRRERIEQMRAEAAEAGDEMPDPERLWFIEDRADVAEWLSERYWQVAALPADDLMARYHRSLPADTTEGTMPTEFVEGVLTE
ncbi:MULTISPECIES: SAM-dependent methyltransferase [unclassified Mycolicibacterium]|uniref:SAM-dependent methyltransferase n=1 Tax=unclassified Mycolicibacterium TaxID=2636767 RepID=UPI0012DF04EC|nr:MULTISPECIES: SAM-dependent methyltransferase [unclassified Mycolicibacterium]MUL81833.1 SAM-dependent methyltransferase [Mycolicibacterium sp. CBMA 329]MUL87599.1 SAM-dependent methyltransferase [Mycolicibacterium sp. CBMA 331]MUL99537.1 SAM-dependent methyltransferase [Mycolicibacterium sp. CBMA 334]MUM26555.1 SAM-dependent methyltransferase [Mycolicibacterium sp. CBMA 295]MUM37896.1 SAM-dependent methyltransferase [Mycolicibacterium sp. CBMA 247]